jgi:hypothetical protein
MTAFDQMLLFNEPFGFVGDFPRQLAHSGLGKFGPSSAIVPRIRIDIT